MFDLGYVVGAMLDPIVIAVAVLAYFAGKSFPEIRWAVTAASALVGAVALFFLVAFLAISEQRAAHSMLLVIYILAIAGWVGICAGVSWLRAISSPPPTEATKTPDRSPS